MGQWGKWLCKIYHSFQNIFLILWVISVGGFYIHGKILYFTQIDFIKEPVTFLGEPLNFLAKKQKVLNIVPGYVH